MMKRRIAWGLVTLVVAAGIGWSLMPQPLPVDIGTVELRAVREYIAEEAKTRLADEYTIDMPISGTLERIELEEGDAVGQDEIVARVETFPIEQEIRGLESMIARERAQITGVDIQKPKKEQLEAARVRVRESRDALDISERDLRIAEINLREADREYVRFQELKERGVASQSQLDEASRLFQGMDQTVARARLARDAARKAVEIAGLELKRTEDSVDDNEYMRDVFSATIVNLEARLEVLQKDLAKAEITSPVSGPVLEKYVEDRRVLPAGTPLLKVGDPETMEIECDVLSEEVVRIGLDDVVEIYGKALGDEIVLGTVKRIYPSAFQKISSLGIEQQRVKVIVAFDNTEPRLRAGTRVDVRIITAEADNVAAIPERAAFRRDGAWFVFAAEGGRARLRAVEIGLKNDTWAEVREGLAVGETFVADPTNDIEDGSRIAAK